MANREAKMIVGAGLAGLAAGILMAPKSGKETRADIQTKANELSDQAAHKLKKGKEKVVDLKQQALEQTRKVKSAIRKSNPDELSAAIMLDDEPLVSM